MTTEKIQLFCSDLDGTLLGNPEAARRFKDAWEALPRRQRPLLCYNSGRLVQDVIDLLATKTNNGSALQWLCDKINVPLVNVLAAGDTGNDSSMFLLPGVKGIVVENAQPELYEAVVKLPTFSASQVLADGVLEGLKNFG